jgi:hypothetical protein
MIQKQRSGVFLSYARKDGEQFAATLREQLREKAPDIEVKQDRLILEGGVGWWKQLTDAIGSVEFLVLVMTSSAIQSETVREASVRLPHRTVPPEPQHTLGGSRAYLSAPRKTSW